MRAQWWPLPAIPQPVVDAWRDLAARALEPNPFGEPELVLAAARHVGDERERFLLSVSDGGHMKACLPVVRTARWRRIPVPTVAAWRHNYCFLGTPLVDAERPDAALAELIAAGTSGRRLLALEWMHSDGPVAAAVRCAASATGVSIARYEHFTRAAVGPHPAGTVRLTLSGDRRRRLGRLLRNLGQSEGAEVRVVHHSGERAIVEHLLALEAKGWKGDAGTAMTVRSGHGKFFAEVCQAFDATGRVRLDALEVGGRAAAVMCSFRAGDGLFLFKIAHDPALARFSPGTQVLAAVVQATAPAWVDSGAAPDESWLNDLLPERRGLASLVVAPPGWAGRVLSSATRSFVAARFRSPTEVEMSRAWLDPDGSFDEAFGVRPMVVEHGLAGHPLLTRDAMIELAATMPSHLIEHHRGRDLDLVMPDLNWDVVEAPPLEVARDIEASGTWMVFWHVEEMPEYDALLHEVLDGVMSRVAGREGGLGPLEGFIFFSAPGTVTPAHVDPEHNFLLQTVGTKRFFAGTYPDVGIQQRTAERYYLGGSHRNLDWLPPEALATELEPGMGVYSPYLCPHWVHNGDEVSISFSATFQTTTRQKWGRVHRFNGRLRRLGFSPRPPGRAVLIDDGKRLVEAVASKAESRRGERGTEHWRRGDEEQMAEGQYGTRVR